MVAGQRTRPWFGPTVHKPKSTQPQPKNLWPSATQVLEATTPLPNPPQFPLVGVAGLDLLRVEPLRLTIPMPPSTNRLYQRIRGGQLALTEEAKRFREQVKSIVVGRIGDVGRLPVDPETVYRVTVDLYLDSLENPGWFEIYDKDTFITRGPKKGQLVGRQGERKAKTRYKVVDTDNRVKFLQDCVCKSVGIPNDCQVFQVWPSKYEDPDNPRVEVTIEVVDSKQFFPKRS